MGVLSVARLGWGREMGLGLGGRGGKGDGKEGAGAGGGGGGVGHLFSIFFLRLFVGIYGVVGDLFKALRLR